MAKNVKRTHPQDNSKIMTNLKSQSSNAKKHNVKVALLLFIIHDSYLLFLLQIFTEQNINSERKNITFAYIPKSIKIYRAKKLYSRKNKFILHNHFSLTVCVGSSQIYILTVI